MTNPTTPEEAKSGVEKLKFFLETCSPKRSTHYISIYFDRHRAFEMCQQLMAQLSHPESEIDIGLTFFCKENTNDEEYIKYDIKEVEQ